MSNNLPSQEVLETTSKKNVSTILKERVQNGIGNAFKKTKEMLERKKREKAEQKEMLERKKEGQRKMLEREKAREKEMLERKKIDEKLINLVSFNEEAKKSMEEILSYHERITSTTLKKFYNKVKDFDGTHLDLGGTRLGNSFEPSEDAKKISTASEGISKNNFLYYKSRAEHYKSVEDADILLNNMVEDLLSTGRTDLPEQGYHASLLCLLYPFLEALGMPKDGEYIKKPLSTDNDKDKIKEELFDERLFYLAVPYSNENIISERDDYYNTYYPDKFRKMSTEIITIGKESALVRGKRAYLGSDDDIICDQNGDNYGYPALSLSKVPENITPETSSEALFNS